MLNMVESTPGKWRGVQSLCIKTPESVALPVYNAMPAYLRKQPVEKEQPPVAAGKGGPAEPSCAVFLLRLHTRFSRHHVFNVQIVWRLQMFSRTTVVMLFFLVTVIATC
jgi:hypothetical protein